MSHESITNAERTSQEKIPPLVKIVNDPQGVTTQVLLRCRPLIRQLSFVLCLGSTRTSDVPEVSAAGATPAARRLTPALDADLLIHGRPVCGSDVPRSPLGVVSPVILTRACALLLEWSMTIIDCGVFQAPKVPSVSLGNRVSECISSGAAQPRSHVESLFEKGVVLGKELAEKSPCLVLAECVPGGTATAMAILSLLGYDVTGLVSTSLPNPNLEIRQELLRAGLSKIKRGGSRFEADPLGAIAAMGDPMQPVVAGIAFGAVDRVPVLLAGGSQMLAVYAIFKKLWAKTKDVNVKPDLAVCTSRWLVNDFSADTRSLAHLLEAPLAFADVNLSQSRYEGLKLYEQGHVKEGCGAGAAILLACLSGEFSEKEIIAALDATYEQMIIDPCTN